MSAYLPVGIFLALALAIVPLTMVLGRFIRPRRYNAVKAEPYECGIEVKEAPPGKISVHFYLVAVVFLVFDVETIFLLPWAVAFDKLGLFGLIEVFVFLALLIAAYVYAWLKGALRWEE
ncbi:MAG: NADH-quinone oxidoreductase subunit A [Acidobacteriota bacterium]